MPKSILIVMKSGIIVIGLSIVIVSVIVYLLKNKKEVEETLKQRNFEKIGRILIISILFISFVWYDCNLFKDLKKYFSMFVVSKKLEIDSKEIANKLEQEYKYYTNAMQKEYGEVEKSPYIPENFEYVEGDINTGYVIQDTNGNQYVWVPCTNKESENIVKLQKKDFYLQAGIRYYDCIDVDYEEFINSALTNGGFYISRYEIGKEGDNLVAKPNIPVLSYISKSEVMKSVNNMYENINCKLINGYAYDTTLEWIEKTNEINIGKYEFDKESNILTGRLKYNNIYDFIDNVMEVSTEEFYETAIYRGFDYSKDIELDSRYNISEDYISNYNEKLKLIAYRTILYK